MLISGSLSGYVVSIDGSMGNRIVEVLYSDVLGRFHPTYPSSKGRAFLPFSLN